MITRIAQCLRRTLFVALLLPAAGFQATPAQRYNRLNDDLNAAYNAAHYSQAEELARQMIALAESSLRDQPGLAAQAVDELAGVERVLGRYAEAEATHKRALAMWERIGGPNSTDVAVCLNNLAMVYYDQARYAEAEQIYQRVRSIFTRAKVPNDASVALVLNNLAGVYAAQGRYADAEPAQKQALRIYEKLYGPQHREVGMSLSNLANFYNAQGRCGDAEPLLRRSLSILEKTLGADHPDVATTLNNLAVVYYLQERYEEEEPLDLRALRIREKVFGPQHYSVAVSLHNLGNAYRGQGRYAEAAPLLERALAIKERVLGADHPDLAYSLHSLASTYFEQARYDEAEKLEDRAIRAREQAGVSPWEQLGPHVLRARITWHKGERDRAMADLAEAIRLSEAQRGLSSGAELDRAEAFAQFAAAFEQMVAWQAERADVAGALASAERGRARMLLDQMQLRGVDLLAGLPANETRALKEREFQARARVTKLGRELDLVADRQGLSREERERERRRLEAELDTAREQALETYRDIRTASPAYRLSVDQNREPVALDALQKWIGPDALLLEYVTGSDASYVVAVPGDGSPARIEPLSASDEQGPKLGVEPGVLAARALRRILEGANEAGVLGLLSDRAHAVEAEPRLAALWEVLVPAPEREAMLAGKIRRLLVVPDGALGLLPFEALVTGTTDSPHYLLDTGVAVLYGPSATVLYNLGQKSRTGSNRPNVLTVGDAAYGAAAATVRAGGEEVASRSRYRSAGGRLVSLPHSATESAWVADNFRAAGSRVTQLVGPAATEAAVRTEVPGQGIIHLACHGLIDETQGNFFGALAVTPGRQAATDSSDDGFLTLPEIHELDLRACELAILSACETNFGPRQRGEGVWGLSRGFLAAGARRVVASDWLVDDEAAASVISYFCGGLAQTQKNGRTPDYARALHDAKLWLRQQEQWQSPYYWASFVFVGPP